MATYVLCNIGLRDVFWQDEQIKPPRSKGKQLLEGWEDESLNELAVPILEPSINYILEQISGPIDTFILFGTDQPDYIEERLRDSDTIYLAYLAQKWLSRRFEERVTQVETRVIADINPSFYDEALEAFDTLLHGLTPEDTCYIVLCGGIPACNTALLLHGVRLYDELLEVIYVPQNGLPQPMRIGAQLQASYQEAAAINHLERWDFANTEPILQGLKVSESQQHLVSYAAQRMNFDFTSAHRSLQHALRDGNPKTRHFINGNASNLKLDVYIQSTQSPEAELESMKLLIRELYWNSEITYKHRRYADFLGRIYRFQESALRYLVETIFEIPTNMGPKTKAETQRAWVEKIKANQELLTFLEERTRDGHDWQQINRPAFKNLLSYATKYQGKQADGEPYIPATQAKQYNTLVKEVNSLDTLVMLRNRSIVAHGFTGISQASIEKEYSRNPIESLRTIVNLFFSLSREQVGPNPYQLIADFVIQQLRETRAS